MTKQIEMWDENVPDNLEGLLARSIKLLRDNEPAAGYYGCFSGGKDSVVLRAVAEEAGVGVDWYYNHTTIDPPELVRFLRDEYPDVKWVKRKHGNFFRRMEEKAHIPTRRVRWCCDEYKESRPPKGVVMLMGIRAEESPARARNWGETGYHNRTGRRVVLPLLHWDAETLWKYSGERGLKQCGLYDEGFRRLGCVGCPLSGPYNQKREFARWPGFEKRWKLSFRRIWDKRAGTLQQDGREWFGSAKFKNWEEMWDWWVNGRSLPK